MTSVLQLLGPSTGGIRRHVATLARLLGDGGWDVDVASPRGVLDGLDLGGRTAAVVDVPTSMSPLALVRARRQLRRLGRHDLVHAHGLKAGWVAVLARPLRPGPRTPIVLTVHNIVLDDVAGRAADVQRRLERRLLRMVDHVIAVSPDIVDAFADDIDPDRIDFIVPASPAPEPQRDRRVVRAELGALDDATPLVVVVARLHPQKDLPMFVDAWEAVHAEHPEARAAIVGEGPLADELASLVARRGLGDSLRLHGPSRYAVEELAAADLVVLSSRWEGAPLVVAEAMQLGRPIVSTRVGVVPEMVGDGGTIVEVGDAPALAATMSRYLAAPELRRTAGAISQQRGTVIYGAAALAEQVAGIYEEVLGR